MMLQPLWPILIAAVVLLGCTLVWGAGHWAGTPTSRHGGRATRINVVARVLLASCAVLIGLHPVGEVRVDVPGETTVDLVLVVDRTTSMGAQDYAGDRPRMDGVAGDLEQLVEELAGANITVVVFDDEARVSLPSTTDATAAVGFVRTIGWRPSDRATGSDISVAVEPATEVLRLGAERRPDHSRYLVYVGDGEQTAESAPASFEPLSDLVDGAMVLGYGTAEGGPMAVTEGADDQVMLGDEVAISQADQGALEAVADQLGGTYHHRTAPGPVPDLVPADARESVTEIRAGEEYYWIAGLVGGVGLLGLLGTAVAAWRVAREEALDAR